MVTVDARLLLSSCAEVAKGARFYAENYSCDDVAGGERQFTQVCLTVIAFALDAIDEHFCALDVEHKLPRDNEKMTLTICYGDNE